jgi:hypothetical protein
VVASTTSLQTQAENVRSDRVVRLLILVGFAAVLGLTMLRHEMWRDELQAWTLTNSSRGVRDLLHNLRYEGHPALWYVLLFPLTKLFDAPEAMQAFQYLVAIAAMGVVVRFAPFTMAQKAALVFGYFMIFEYGALSRSYSLGVLLVFVACTVASRPRRSWWAVGAVLALLSLTSAFGAMLAVAIGAGLIVDELLRRRNGDFGAASLQSLAVGATIALGGVIISYAQSIPPDDAGEFRGWRTTIQAGEVGSTLAAVWRAFVPIPQLQREFWNTNVADGRVTIAAIISVIIIGAVAIMFRSKPAALVMWGLGLATVLVFLYAKIAYASSGRHFGHIFVLFLAMNWLAPSAQEFRATLGEEHGAGVKPLERRAALLTVVLGLHLLGGAFATISDWTTPFSDGKSVAEYLQREGYRDSIVIGFPDTSASTVAAYLQRDVFFPQGGRFGNYIIWDTKRVSPTGSLSELLREFAAVDGPRVLILRTSPYPVTPDDVRLLHVFDDGIVADEHYWLYLVDR